LNRHPDIDKAKGLAILFVVFGHLVARADPLGVQWYEPLRRAVYAFHMPFFLYLSGMVAVLSGSLFTRPGGWPGLLKQRAIRLLVPFFGIGLVIVLAKLAASRIMFVDNAPLGIWAGISSMVWDTSHSAAISIWYLFVLFVLSLACPLLLRGQATRLPVLLAVTLLLYAAGLPAYCYLDHIGRYAVFFVLGALAANAGDRWNNLLDRHWRVFFLLFAMGFLADMAWGRNWPLAPVLLVLGTVSMPALHGLVRSFPVTSLQSLHVLGRYCFVIYLFNTMFIGLTKGLLLHVAGWDGWHFLPFAAAMMAAGLSGPLMLKFLLLRRNRFLDRLTS